MTGWGWPDGDRRKRKDKKTPACNSVKAVKFAERPNCHYCHRPFFAIDEATIDHKVPRCRGGKTTMENVVLACEECNSRKADQSYEMFMVIIGRKA